MGRFADYLRNERQRRKRSGRGVSRHRRALMLSDGAEVIPLSTRYLDVLVIRHRWSGRVFCTVVLPVGVLADLGMVHLEEMAMSFLTRAVSPGVNGKRGVVAPLDWSRDLPALTEYMYSSVYPDGEARQLATLSVMAGDVTGVKCCLNDRAEGRSLWATGPDLAGCLEALEAMLQSPACPWRQDSKPRAQQPKK